MTDHGGFRVGAVLAGRYRVDRVLGQGGMGIVVQATHLQLYQPVAIKLLLPEMLGNQQVVQRFLREAQAAVRLKSEHVARVIDVGSLETGAPYMVLEYLDGTDLSNIPRAQLTVGGIIDLMLQACEALAEAHSLGIVHRDIKPANFFITRGTGGAPLLKVLDFGISKTPMTGHNLTATQAVMGTPAYMSPEQMRSSRDVDHRSDIWSLGIVLYELVQGAPPFGGDTFSSMVLKVVNEPLPKLTVRLPGDLQDVIYRCLEKDPARRFQNVAELAQALSKYAQSDAQAAITVQRTKGIAGPPTSPGLEPSAYPSSVPSTLSGAARARTATSSHGRRWPALTVMGLLIVGIVVAITAASRGGKTEDPPVGARPEAPKVPVPDPAAKPTPTPTSPSPTSPPVAPSPAPASPPAVVAPANPAPAPPATAMAPPAPPVQAPPVKKPKKPAKPQAQPAKPENPPSKPAPADDGILDKRN